MGRPIPYKKAKSLDERLEFLLQSTESLHQSCQELHASTTEQGRQMDELRLVTAQHGQELRHFHRVMRTAFDAYLNDNDDEGNGDER